MEEELHRALDRCASLSPDVREIGRRDLERLFRAGSAVAGVELAQYVLSEEFSCSLGKAAATDLLVQEVRCSGDPSAFLNIYYYAGDLVSDKLLGELLTLAAPNSAEAEEILKARLPDWRHPQA